MGEKVESPFPKIELFDLWRPVKKLAHFVFDQMHFDIPNTGAAPMLDEQLSFDYDRPS